MESEKEPIVTPVTEPAEQPKEESLEDIQRQIKELEQNNLRLAKERLAQLKAEAQKYTFPQKNIEKVEKSKEEDKNPLELIEDEFKKIDFAIKNYPSGHPARAPYEKDKEYLGVPLIKAFARWADGEDLKEIFNHPLNNLSKSNKIY